MLAEALEMIHLLFEAFDQRCIARERVHDGLNLDVMAPQEPIEEGQRRHDHQNG